MIEDVWKISFVFKLVYFFLSSWDIRAIKSQKVTTVTRNHKTSSSKRKIVKISYLTSHTLLMWSSGPFTWLLCKNLFWCSKTLRKLILQETYSFNINWIHCFQLLQMSTCARIKQTAKKAIHLGEVWHDLPK